MIIVTGGAGFIGSAVIAKLNSLRIRDIIVVDNLGTSSKWLNLRGLHFAEYLHKDDFRELLALSNTLPWSVTGIVHMGACSSTAEEDMDYLFENNVEFSKLLTLYAREQDIRMVYASSAATYGAGQSGFSDSSAPQDLIPLNRYGYSKNFFDGWAAENGHFPSIVGLKFFNVYGPNEYHKDSMRSMVHRAYEQLSNTGTIRLFRSYRDDYKDGEQKRDFVYVKDCAEIATTLLERPDIGGVLNVGTGQARSWSDLARAVLKACGTQEERIEYIDMPDNLRAHYQYFTEADTKKLRAALGEAFAFTSLERGVEDYISHYLSTPFPFLNGANFVSQGRVSQGLVSRGKGG